MGKARRPYDRTLSEEPGLKKPRLVDDQVAADRISNVRSGYMQRQVPSNSGSGARIQRDRNSEISDSRRPSQLQHSQIPHLELVNQYKSALSELTFNSKPIITNLTIIAGENLHAAKAIASTVCINILKVPKERKLPSLYLLDSIVKNIGRDYIKYFATSLPEVFCKVYRQVDPSIHQGMRHLFGTWRGVFPPEPLHIIQKELGFTNSASDPALGMATSRTEAQTSRPSGHAHGIHVNPKYLEAQGSASEISEALASSHEVEAPGRPTSNKIHQRNQGIQIFSVGDKKVSSMPYLDLGYGSSLSTRPSIDTVVRAKEKHKDRQLDRTLYESDSEIAVQNLPNERNGFGIKHGIERYTEHPSIKNPSVISRSWKNSEEEEYAWDDMSTKVISHGAAQTADCLFKNDWTSANYEKEDFGSYLQRPARLNDRELDIYDDARVDFSSSRTDPDVSETQLQFKNALRYSDGYLSSHDSSSKIGRTPFQSQLRDSPNGSQNLSVSRAMMSQDRDYVTQQRQMNAAKKHHPTSLSERKFSQQPTDPRRPPLSTGSHDGFLQNSLPSLPKQVHQSNAQKRKLQSVHAATSIMPTSQKRKHTPSTQLRKPEVSKLVISSDVQNLMSSQVSRSGSRSNLESSSSGHSNHLTVDSPGQSINSNILTGAKTILADIPSPASSSSKASFQDVGLADADEPASSSAQDASFSHGVGVEEIPSAISPSSDPVSSLLSSLVDKGLISGSKLVPPISSSTHRLSPQPPVQPFFSSTTSTPDSSVHVSQSTTEIKNLIGFEFRPDVVRNLHPNVLADLFSELSHRCVTCGVRLNYEDSISKHMEWHASREQNSLSMNSRSWYKSLLDWSIEIGHDVPEESPLDLEGETGLESESIEHLVPADESQTACVLCGELFEDMYCIKRDEWMFKEAVYMSIYDESSGSMGPIVHVDCNSEDFTHNFRLLSDSKPEP